MGMDKPHRLRALMALVGVGVLAACGTDAGNGPTNEAGVADSTSVPLDDGFDPNAHFRAAFNQMPGSWDPIDSVNGSDFHFFAPVYDQLLYEDPDGQIEPMLASSFTPNPDGTALVLELQQGLSFSDGTPFNAEAVKFNLDRTRAADSTIAGELGMVTSVEVLDEHTVEVGFDGGIGSVPAALASRPGMMVSPAAAAAGTLVDEPIGIGPYVVTETAPGARADFAKTEDYWDPDAQRVATMSYLLILEDQARYNALTSGEVDAAVINADQIPTASAADLTVLSRPSLNFIFFALNTNVAPFDDVEARKAVNMAIDREAIAQGLYDGYCTPSALPFLEGSAGYSEKHGDGLSAFPYDPEQAKSVLGDLPNSVTTFDNVAPNVTIYTKLAEVLQSQLSEVGIQTAVKPVPAPQVSQDFGLDQNAELATLVYVGVSDPNGLVTRFLAPQAIYNPGQLANEEILAGATKGAASLDPSQRKIGFDAMAGAWLENPPQIVPICHLHIATGLSPEVSNVQQATNGGARYRGVALSPA